MHCCWPSSTSVQQLLARAVVIESAVTLHDQQQMLCRFFATTLDIQDLGELLLADMVHHIVGDRLPDDEARRLFDDLRVRGAASLVASASAIV